MGLSYRHLWGASIALLLILFSGCSESPERISQKLDALCQDELRYIVAEVVRNGADSTLLDRPYYKIDSLIYFQGDTSAIFSAYAQVSYHYFKEIRLYRERKYRYWTDYLYWDRFSKKLLHYPDTLNRE